MIEPTTGVRLAEGDQTADDGALVRALKAGEPDAPRQLVERFGGLLFGLCLRMMGQREDAEDVLQETLLRALRGLAGFDGERPLRPWLVGIAANRCRTALGRRSKRPVAVGNPEEAPDHRPGLADPDDLAGELERAIARLRPDYRTVFALYHEQALSYEEIAESLNRPVGTIKTWLHRARADLADDLARRGIDCP